MPSLFVCVIFLLGHLKYDSDINIKLQGFSEMSQEYLFLEYVLFGYETVRLDSMDA